MDVLKQKIWGKGLGIFKLKTLVVGWVALLAYEFIITNTTTIFNNISSLGYKIYKYKIKCRSRLKTNSKWKCTFIYSEIISIIITLLQRSQKVAIKSS